MIQVLDNAARAYPYGCALALAIAVLLLWVIDRTGLK